MIREVALFCTNCNCRRRGRETWFYNRKTTAKNDDRDRRRGAAAQRCDRLLSGTSS